MRLANRSALVNMAKSQGWTCIYCLEPFQNDGNRYSPKRATTEHLTSVALGGSKRGVANLAASCSACNRRKGVLGHDTYVLAMYDLALRKQLNRLAGAFRSRTGYIAGDEMPQALWMIAHRHVFEIPAWPELDIPPMPWTT